MSNSPFDQFDTEDFDMDLATLLNDLDHSEPIKAVSIEDRGVHQTPQINQGAEAIGLSDQQLLSALSEVAVAHQQNFNALNQNASIAWCFMQPSFENAMATAALVFHERKGKGPFSVKRCSNCGSTSTPSWRRDREGKSLLCNACGLYLKLHNKKRPFSVQDDGTVKVQRASSIENHVCANCATRDTPLWRRGDNNESLCNACGLYYKQHKSYRPAIKKKSTKSNDKLIEEKNDSLSDDSGAGTKSGTSTPSSTEGNFFTDDQIQTNLHDWVDSPKEEITTWSV